MGIERKMTGINTPTADNRGQRMYQWYNRKSMATVLVGIGIISICLITALLLSAQTLSTMLMVILVAAIVLVVAAVGLIHYRLTKNRLVLEEKLRLFFEQDLMGLLLFQNKRPVYINETAARLVGVKAEELMVLSLDEFMNFIHPDDRSFIIRQATMVTQGDDDPTAHYSARLLTFSGRIKWVELYFQTMLYGGSNAEFICVVDRTAQQVAEDAFKESESRFRRLVETMHEGVAIIDIRQTFAYVNESLTAIFGLTKDQIIGASLSTVFDSRTIESITAQLECAQAGEGTTPEMTRVIVDGRSKSVLISANIIHDSQNKPSGSFVVITDITERARAVEALQNSEHMLKTVLDTIPVRVFWKDKNLNYLGCNHLFAGDAGLNIPGEIVGKNDYELSWKEQADLYRADDRHVIDSGIARLNYEEPQSGPEGKKSWLRTTKIPLKDTDGHTFGVLGTYEDITERKQTEEALRRSLQSAADIVEAIPSGLFIYQYEPPDRLVLVDANPEARLLIGIQLETWRGRLFEDILPASEENGVLDALLEVMQTGKTYNSDNLKYQDDRLNAVLRIRAFRMPENKLGVALENVTEHQRAYEILRESEGRYRFLYKNLPVMIHSIDCQGHIVGVSNLWLETMGYARNEVIGHKSIEFLAPESRQYAEETVIPMFFTTGECRDIPYQFVKKNGEVMDVILSAVAERDEDQNIMRSIATLLNVTGLREKERKILTFYRAVEQSPGTVMIVDLNGNAVYVNPRYLQVTGCDTSEIIGRRADVFETATQQSGQDIWRQVNAGETWTGTVQRRRKNGERYWKRVSISPIVDDGGRIINFLISGEDITSEVRTYQRLAESDKLSAIGVLAAGVAHEFKNYLCGIIGNASMLAQDIDRSCPADQVRDGLNVIIEIGERASNLTTSLLTYSKARPAVYQEENLRTIIDNTITLVEKEMKKLSIELFTYFEEIPPVYASAGSVQQLVLNLLINAQQAIDGRGVITVALHKERDRIRLEVGDSGRGIPAEIMPHIFDPFFSTKGVWGKEDSGGTGMGLAISRNIAYEHGGELTAQSIPGVGSVFTFSLPLTGDLEQQSDGSDNSSFSPGFVLCTTDLTLAEAYFGQAQQLHSHIFWIDTPARLDSRSPLVAAGIICDNAVLGTGAMMQRFSSAADPTPPWAVVNHPTGKLTETDYARGLTACFKGTPELKTIIGQMRISRDVSRPLTQF